MHSQRRLDARRDRVRRRRGRRRLALRALGVLALAVVGVVALRPHPSRSTPTLTPGQEAAASQTARDWRLALRGWRTHRGPVPILMYHRLEKPGSAPGAPELFVAPRLFRAQLAALRRHGYHPVTLARVDAAWRRGALLPRKPVVLTFDDGYRSQYTVAFRTMRRLRWPGTLFLLPGSTSIPVGPTDRQVRTMLAAGWELGAHTINHRDLRREAGADLREQTAGARRVLERRFHRPVTDLAYPMGEYDRDTIRAVRAAGYATAATVDPGLADRRRPYELSRIRVDQSDTPAVLLRTLTDRGQPPG